MSVLETLSGIRAWVRRGFQPLDATLTALAAHNTNGLVTQTAADTFTGRTITGTANQITVTNGDGVANNPTLSLPADVLIPTVITAPNSGLHLLDTNASHDLILRPGSDLTADRTLSIFTGDADRSLDIRADTVLDWGTYTPTLTAVANVAATTAYLSTWMRVGNTVTVSWTADIDPTTTATLTQFRISLPVASNFGSSIQGRGVIASSTANTVGEVQSVAATDDMLASWICSTASNQNVSGIFAYQVI